MAPVSKKGREMIAYSGVSTLEILEEARNYNNWIASQIVPHIKAPACEVGAGTGNLTRFFLDVKQLHITDKDQGLVDKLKKTFSHRRNISIGELDIEKAPPERLKNKFASVFGINVLEHIEDDVAALGHARSLLHSHGKLILLVPAKKFAYTRLDRELGHFRRYEKQELEEKLHRTRFEIESLYFFNIVGLLSWYVRDKVKRRNVHLKPSHIKIFDSIVPFLRIAESAIPVPVGISLLVIAKKI